MVLILSMGMVLSFGRLHARPVDMIAYLSTHHTYPPKKKEKDQQSLHKLDQR